MKTTLKYMVLGWGTLLTAVSCQKVIDVDLKNETPKYIIDALVTDETGYNRITITKSKPFDEDNTFETVTDASVWVKDITTGTDYPFLINTGNKYVNDLFATELGKDYALTIVIGSDTITSTCSVPQTKVEIDSIRIERSEFSNFIGRDIYVGIPVYKDPQGLGNNYMLKTYINGENYAVSSVDNDEFIDGKYNKSSITFRDVDFSDTTAREFENGDTLAVELYCIIKPVYRFYFTLAQNGSGAISNPANPISNVYGKDALGVFNAATVSRVSLVAQY